MNQTLSAVYEHGSLRLLEPLDLAESSPVLVQILEPKENFRRLAFRRKLASIRELLGRFEKEQQGDLLDTAVLQILETDLQTLWSLSQPPRRMLCTMLQLAVKRLRPETLGAEQIRAFGFVLEQMALPTVTDETIHLCLERLAAAGVPATFAFSAELVQSYVDEI